MAVSEKRLPAPPLNKFSSMETQKILKSPSADHYKQKIIQHLAEKNSFIQDTHSVFRKRFDAHFPVIFARYRLLYAKNEGFERALVELFNSILENWENRSDRLKAIDQYRIEHPDWFQKNSMLGGVCYVDLYADSLSGIREKIPYFKELGLNYLHLMPFFLSPEGENDGGYAVSSYRQVNPALGNMEDLKSLIEELHANGIMVVADFILNHTSHEHIWAQKAKQHDPKFSNFYYLFKDKTIPLKYEKNLREIFPDERQGSFTYLKDKDQWVWTTFHSYQWDLNYSNPKVFNAMAAEMLFLANCGVEVLRLDAVAFIWKEMGTSCENLPQAHAIIQALNAVCRIAAPAVLFKSEAIVHPDEVSKYIHLDECQLSYNPLLMALLWICLASQEVRLLNVSLRKKFEIPRGCAWVNYLRCHDDIGWTFDDQDAEALQIHPYFHRKWLNDFYSGQAPGSFSAGLLFQENPKTGDARISGTAASLAGLEKALSSADEHLIDLAVDRILMLHGIIMTIGGIPLIYLGDEVGQLNDYSFLQDSVKAKDSRWVHRVGMDWTIFERFKTSHTPERRIFDGLKKLINLRKSHAVFSDSAMKVLQTHNDHVFGFMLQGQNEKCCIFSNFTPQEQHVSASVLAQWFIRENCVELLTGAPFPVDQDYRMKPYQQLMILTGDL